MKCNWYASLDIAQMLALSNYSGKLLGESFFLDLSGQKLMPALCCQMGDGTSAKAG